MCHRKTIQSVGAVVLLSVIATTSAATVGYYPMEDGSGTAVRDASGKGHDATIVGTVNWVQSQPGLGTALDFPGTAGNYVRAGTWNPSESTGQLSLAAWIKWAGATSAYQGIIGKADGTGTSTCWQLTINSAATSEIGFAGGFPNWLAPAPPVGQWEHVAVTYDGSTATMYINGVSTGTNVGGTLGAATAATITIGARTLTSAGDAAFKGTIDEVYIFDKALSAADVGGVMQGMFANPYKSRSPNPSNFATDVFRDTTLSWTAAQDAVSHDVYLGTDVAAVQNATKADAKGVLAAAEQADTTYDPPGHLELGRTYYWRVDEVNSAGPAHPTKGDVWSFTVEPSTYPIKNITASASGFVAGCGPENTINGSGLDADDLHAMDRTAMWLVKAAATPSWIQYDFDRVYKVDQMWVWNFNYMETMLGFGLQDVTIDYTPDGDTWVKLGDFKFADAPGEDGYAHNTVVDFGGVAVKGVRITVVSGWGTMGQYGLSEVRFLYVPVQASHPSPDSGTTGVTPETALTWRPGRQAASHRIFMGTDPNALTSAGTTVANSFAPAALSLDAKYYWRVDEVNEAETPSTWAGDVWNFATADFLAVDDFESYNDQEGSTVFNIWTDGYGSTTNGGQIGYDSPGPFMEKTIRHGGSQSAPFYYKNATQSYSEATRTFDTAQDWTIGRADTLRLWVQGRPANLPTGSLPAGTDVFDISSGGSDIYQATDQFRLVYRQLTGNGSITARVDYQQPTNQYAKAGVMIRVGLDIGALQAYLATLPGTPNTTTIPTQIEWSFRPTIGDATARSQSTTPTPMATWVRLTRTGDILKGEYSVDGVTWVSTDITTTPQTIAMGNPVNIGLIVCSHVATQLGEAMFSHVKTTGNVTGEWKTADIGITPQPASNTADTFYVGLTDSAGRSKTIIPTVASPVCTTGTWQSVDIPLSQFTGVTMGSIKSMTFGVGDKTGTSPLHGEGLLYIDDIGVGRPAQ
jgi:hypothetical protein